MSTTDTGGALDQCRTADAEPVTIPAGALASTAPGYLRDLKYELSSRGQVPAELTLDACFDAECSLATQEEADRVREHVRAAAFLGAARLRVRIDTVADEGKVRPALSACAERARREGIALEVEGPVSI